MRKVRRDEIVDHETYADLRDTFRRDVMAAKRLRRMHLGEHLTLLFENPLTVRYQVQEMMRAERIVREVDILHEIRTYNDLLGGAGELGCTLLIEIERPEERERRLQEWRDLPEHLYLRLEDARRIPPRLDERQRDGTRLSSVQYLKFDLGGQVPVAAGVHHAGLDLEVPFGPEQRAALREDLETDSG